MLKGRAIVLKDPWLAISNHIAIGGRLHAISEPQVVTNVICQWAMCDIGDGVIRRLDEQRHSPLGWCDTPMRWADSDSTNRAIDNRKSVNPWYKGHCDCDRWCANISNQQLRPHIKGHWPSTIAISDYGAEQIGFINVVAYYLKSRFLDFQYIPVYLVFLAIFGMRFAIFDRMAYSMGL